MLNLKLYWVVLKLLKISFYKILLTAFNNGNATQTGLKVGVYSMVSRVPSLEKGNLKIEAWKRRRDVKETIQSSLWRQRMPVAGNSLILINGS